MPFDIYDVASLGIGKQCQPLGTYARTRTKLRSGLRTGICDEHGGEPSSVKFCARVGMNYASCSPFRVPIARLAAAQAAVEDEK